jgi:tetratricopeptide (TPR) repeat protein
MPAADLGPENPLPPITPIAVPQAAPKIDASVDPEDRDFLGWGCPPGLLPYRLQDGYDRQRTPRAFRVAVLENQHLRATFFPELGGRLWSLVHKPTGRELFSRNPVFQPGNLGLRNAWFSGGVEWNIGWTGHWPYTCSPLFAACTKLPDGTPVLRMWEWERVRQVPLQIDAWLPDGSQVLFVRVAIRNPSHDIVPMYWWSNIAVEEHTDTRVLVPATRALVYDPLAKAHACINVPFHGDLPDSSYPGRCRKIRGDHFYCLPAGARPWIAAVEPSGRGLFQTSTQRLRGRKLFRWGIHDGGRRWQEWLETPAYIEIQAGLARSQGHHLPMPPLATWSWIEAYGDLGIAPAAAYEKDWARAQQAAAAGIEALIPSAKLDAMLQESEQWASVPPTSAPFCCGSGWGALEAARRKKAGEAAMELPGIVFSADNLGAEQQPWTALLESGRFPEGDPREGPGNFMVQREWMESLEKSLALPGGRHWRALFHYGVMLWHQGRHNEAVARWKESLRRTRNPWAEYCLGASELGRQPAKAAQRFGRAFAQRPDLVPLAIEWLSTLLKCGKPGKVLQAVKALPEAMRAVGRIRLLAGQALLATGRLNDLEALLQGPFVVPDMREGEVTTSDLWFGLHAKRLARKRGVAVDDTIAAEAAALHPVPRHLDFRMHA